MWYTKSKNSLTKISSSYSNHHYFLTKNYLYMSLVKWNPRSGLFSPLSSMMENFFNDEFLPLKNGNGATAPAVNVTDNEKSYDVEVAAPGMKKEDFNVAVDNGVLTISSEKETETEETKDNYTRKEFSYSSFSRSFGLPENVDDKKIKAKYDNGILKITIPKTKAKKKETSKTIAIS